MTAVAEGVDAIAAKGNAAATRELVTAQRAEELTRRVGLAPLSSAEITDRAARAARAADDFDLIERMIRIRGALGGATLKTLRELMTVRVLRAPALERLSVVSRAVVEAEVFRLLESLLDRLAKDPQLLQSVRQGTKVFRGTPILVAGVIREVFGCTLPVIERRVRLLRIKAAGERLTNPLIPADVIDSHLLGAVEMPTLKRQGQREIKLGTDRLVGTGVRKPQTIEEKLPDGSVIKLRVEGTLNVKLAVEVKGQTTASGGIRQILALQARGGDPGYVIIGKKLWLVQYDRRTVEHFVVAPEGDELRKAARYAASLRGDGMSITVLAIPAAVDKQIVGAAKLLVDATVTAAATRVTP
ncbi:hypothetical protein [Kineococcus sp. SYSU DK005]|uniref:hypothetical protein n=1 Tax=Kineococcus sp. SYSU DK005 TaxID=3383126 RepID=UPI003D7F1707